MVITVTVSLHEKLLHNSAIHVHKPPAPSFVKREGLLLRNGIGTVLRVIKM